jgi:hypothetical protein
MGYRWDMLRRAAPCHFNAYLREYFFSKVHSFQYVVLASAYVMFDFNCFRGPSLSPRWSTSDPAPLFDHPASGKEQQHSSSSRRVLVLVVWYGHGHASIREDMKTQ